MKGLLKLSSGQVKILFKFFNFILKKFQTYKTYYENTKYFRVLQMLTSHITTGQIVKIRELTLLQYFYLLYYCSTDLTQISLFAPLHAS